ncbi:transcriptional activator DEMETER-like [Mercurialis annua]|uniref:transcriptional activator DEMETER-like n=1 Tax=Mercurialis annua TaxID=3986 RepID=UPI0024AFA88E|nr:transcriptional activator DEMETER-like [Mercurialis annua]
MKYARQSCDDVSQDSNLEMKSGKHLQSELKLEITRRSTRIACTMSKTFDCQTNSSLTHTSFLKGCRSKRQRKSEASILALHIKEKRHEGSNRRRIESNAIVPYRKSHSAKSRDVGAIVPYQSPKRKLKALVLLDDETLRQYNLVMKIDDGVGEKQEDEERQKKWEEERTIFLARIKSFSSKMHLILGDRRFKPWKGSVLDSLVGVFLTQNVTDFLSSAAYMSLASKFPIRSTSNQEASDDELENEYGQESIGADSVYTGTPEDSNGNRYYVAEPESKTSVDVEDTGRTIIQLEPHIVLTCENPSRATEGINPLSSSKRLNCGTFEKPCSSSSARNNSHFIKDNQAENGHEEKVLLDMDCSSVAEVEIEKTLSKEQNKPEEMVCEDCALHPITSISSMKDNSSGVASAMTKKTSKGKKKVVEEKRNWNEIGREYSRHRSRAATDSVDWEAVRHAPQSEVADAIRSRGQHNNIAERIKAVLNHINEHHGSLDLEWLRYAPHDIVKKYLLEIRGIGLKSVECLRLLTLHHRAFPVDTNVARIAVRLGWVPLEPLPGNLQLHLLEEYPVMDTIQKYLWSRLCKLDEQELYELHYQMITFGKVFCTKLNPNCGVCPMRAECKHLASATASKTLCLPRPSGKGEEMFEVPSLCFENSADVANSALVRDSTPISTQTQEPDFANQTSEPIIEEPKSPQLIDDIEDFGMRYGIDEHIVNKDEEIPTLILSNEPFRTNVQCFMDNYWNIHQPEGSSRAIVPLSVNVDSVPVRKLKNISRLRTEHQVYELPDDHPLLVGRRKRDRNDHSPYLLAIWSPGETPGSCQPPKKTCNFQGPDQLCNDKTCSFCENVRETTSKTVRGTILVPCRTAMRGRFPLNGTYFQVNEVFADHETSQNPIIVPRSSIWNLPRRTVCFGTSPNTIFKGCSLEGIQENFWKGFICVKGLEVNTGAPKPLVKRFHCPTGKTKTRVRKSLKEGDAKSTRSMR